MGSLTGHAAQLTSKFTLGQQAPVRRTLSSGLDLRNVVVPKVADGIEGVPHSMPGDHLRRHLPDTPSIVARGWSIAGAASSSHTWSRPLASNALCQ